MTFVKMQFIFNTASRIRSALRRHEVEPNAELDVDPTGPYHIGELRTFNAGQCIDRAEPNGALMFLPAGKRRGHASIWLTGDASPARMVVARSFSTALLNKQVELGDCHPRATVDISLAPHLVNARYSGTLAGHAYRAGVAKRRPTAMFYDASMALYPHGCENTLALEVAYKNESIDALLLDALLWTQQGTDSPLPIWQPVNFLGIKVCHETNNVDPFRPAWAVVRATKADEAGRGTTEIFLFNASAEWEQTWRTQLEGTHLTDVKLITDQHAVELKLSFFHPALPDEYEGQAQRIKVDQEMLNKAFFKGLGMEPLLTPAEKCEKWVKSVQMS